MWQRMCGRPIAGGLVPLAAVLVIQFASASAQTASSDAQLVDAPPAQRDLATLPLLAAIPKPIPIFNPGYTAAPPVELDATGKASFYLHGLLNVGTILGPAAEAAAVMTSPPKAYPKDWRQGATAYARNFGASFGRTQTAEFGRFVVGLGLHEDPRYYPAANRNIGARIVHAIGFTLVDRSDSGHSRAAFATMVGATAGGFIGNAYLPESYTNLRHVAMRIGIQMGTFAVGNVIEEFAPETRRLTQALNNRFHPNN
jgi:hypothetical protein